MARKKDKGWIKINPKEITRSILESQKEKRDRINKERRELRDSLDKELDTGSECRVCGGKIVEFRTEVRRQRTGMERIGGCDSAMGISPPVDYRSEYYCQKCKIKYNSPPPNDINRT